MYSIESTGLNHSVEYKCPKVCYGVVYFPSKYFGFAAVDSDNLIEILQFDYKFKLIDFNETIASYDNLQNLLSKDANDNVLYIRKGPKEILCLFGIDTYGYADSLIVKYEECRQISMFYPMLLGDKMVIITRKGELIVVVMKSTKDYELVNALSLPFSKRGCTYKSDICKKERYLIVSETFETHTMENLDRSSMIGLFVCEIKQEKNMIRLLHRLSLEDLQTRNLLGVGLRLSYVGLTYKNTNDDFPVVLGIEGVEEQVISAYKFDTLEFNIYQKKFLLSKEPISQVAKFEDCFYCISQEGVFFLIDIREQSQKKNKPSKWCILI